MNEQDWENVKWHKKSSEKSGGKNFPENPTGTKKFRKLDSDDPTGNIKIDRSVSNSIKNARAQNKLTQSQLATKSNVPLNVLVSFENGTALMTPSHRSQLLKIQKTLRN